VIRFDQGTRRFNYRVVGVAIHDNAVLLHRADHDPFWTLPGGRAEHGETAEETITREMREELATTVDVVRLVWLVESFFDYEGLSYHEIALYFLIALPPGSAPLTADTFDSADASSPTRFRWFGIEPERLARLPLLPAFLPRGLANLPTSVVHLVQRDDERERTGIDGHRE
jgi:ADP-ribose pyrophosphatase YjhB (NUDIX family)